MEKKDETKEKIIEQAINQAEANVLLDELPLEKKYVENFKKEKIKIFTLQRRKNGKI